ncbi:MAG: hypothetical protein AB6733_15475 [Clostridiaceae bacterium]
MQIKEKIVSIIFIIFLVAPTLSFVLIGSKFDNTNYENRTLAAKPTFLKESLDKYFQGLDNYINDHAAFKNQFVKLNSFLDFKLFNTTSSEKVLVGKDQWLFYKNKTEGDPISTYQGINKYSIEQLNIIKDNLVAIKNKLKKQNKEFVLFIALNKEEIYPEFMPSAIKVVNEYKGTDELVDFIRKNTDIKVVYPKEELLDVKRQYQVYYKYDTHWNKVGAFVGAQQLTKELTGKRKQIEDVKVINHGVPKNDLSAMINLKDYLKGDSELVVSGYKDNVKIKQTYISEKPGARINKFQSNAQDKRKIMIIRDSFGSYFFSYIPKEFQNSVFINRNDFKNEFFKNENPDIVVYQVAERFTSTLLDKVNELNK